MQIFIGRRTGRKKRRRKFILEQLVLLSSWESPDDTLVQGFSASSGQFFIGGSCPGHPWPPLTRCQDRCSSSPPCDNQKCFQRLPSVPWWQGHQIKCRIPISIRISDNSEYIFLVYLKYFMAHPYMKKSFIVYLEFKYLEFSWMSCIFICSIW